MSPPATACAAVTAPSSRHQDESLPNAFYVQQKRAERIASVSGAIAFLTIAIVAFTESLAPWIGPVMIFFAILVPIWILIVRRNKGPVRFRLGASGFELEFSSHAARESRTVPWADLPIRLRLVWYTLRIVTWARTDSAPDSPKVKWLFAHDVTFADRHSLSSSGAHGST